MRSHVRYCRGALRVPVESSASAVSAAARLLALILLATPATAVSAAEAPDAEAPLDVEEILTTPADDYVKTERCIRTTRIRDVDILDDKTLTFEVGRDKFYLVQLKRRCPMLRPTSTIAYEPRTGRSLCALDSFHAISGGGFSRQTGPACQITGFQPVTREQVMVLKEELKRERKKGRLVDDEPAPEPAGEAASDDSAGETAEATSAPG